MIYSLSRFLGRLILSALFFIKKKIELFFDVNILCCIFACPKGFVLDEIILDNKYQSYG